MPLTETGEGVLSSMKRTYADKGGDKKAKSVFYASINKKKKGSSKWHAKGPKARIQAEALESKS